MSNIMVIPRFRPLNRREMTENNGNNVVVEFENDQAFTIMDGGKPHRFTFDRVFPPTCRQVEMFEFVGIPILKDVFQGYNATIFAYGQTGSGKTHSMMGDMKDDEQKGIIPRIVEAVFEGIQASDASINFTVKVSYVEIYNEKIRDLMDHDKQNLRIRESPTGVWIEDVTQTYVSSTEQVYKVMQTGGDNRAKSATLMNAESSRSHSVFIITVGQEDTTTGSKRGAKLTLVDLAGSEKIAKTGAEGERLKEAQNINKSLSALGNVINALTTAPAPGPNGKAAPKHIPYRDSKLTYLLSDSLGGNSKTALIITGSPSEFNVEETLSTIRFGNRAKNIKNKPKQNQERSAAEYQRLLNTAAAKISAQEAVLTALEAEVAAYRMCMCKGDPEQLPAPLATAYMGAVARVARDNAGHPGWKKYLLSQEEEEKAAAAAAAAAAALAGLASPGSNGSGAFAALEGLASPGAESTADSAATATTATDADADADADNADHDTGDMDAEGAEGEAEDTVSGLSRRGKAGAGPGAIDRRTSSLTMAKNTRELLSVNDALEAELEAARRDAEDARAQLEAARAAADAASEDAAGKIARLEAAVAEATEARDEAERRVRDEEERAKLTEQKRALHEQERSSELDDARRDGEETRARLLALKASLAEAEAERAALDAAREDAAARASKAERLIKRLKSRHGAGWVEEVEAEAAAAGASSDDDTADDNKEASASAAATATAGAAGAVAGGQRMKLSPSEAAAMIRQLKDQNASFKSALQRKCEQYVNSQTALLAYKEHVASLEHSLEDAQRAAHDDALAHALETAAFHDKLTATEMMCQKLLDSGRYWRSQGVYSRFTRGAGVGAGAGGRIVVPMQGGGGSHPSANIVTAAAGAAAAAAGHVNVTPVKTTTSSSKGMNAFF